MTCSSCTYTKNNVLVTLCGLCEAKAIAERVRWWQEGKQKLQKKIDIEKKISKTVRTNTLDRLHIPHSDVFYVRQAVEAYYGKKFSLKHVEAAMRAEGWTD